MERLRDQQQALRSRQCCRAAGGGERAAWTVVVDMMLFIWQGGKGTLALGNRALTIGADSV